MDNHLHLRVPKRLIKALLVLTVAAAVITPIAVSASHQFTDVPDTNIFHENIAWLADNDVTKGCNPPTNDMFCPGDNVTREQMAAFMQRLAEGKVVDAATAVDSDMLDGLDSTDLITTASSQTFDWYDSGPNIELTATPAGVLETTVSAPAAGVLLVNGAGSYGNSATAAGDWFFQWLEVDDGTCTFGALFTPLNAVDGTFMWVTSDGAGSEYPATSIGLVEVAAGAHTVTLCAMHSGGQGDLIHGSVIGTYLPGGSTDVLVPAAAASGSQSGGGGDS